MIRLRPSGADEVLIKRVRDWYEPGPGVFIAPQAMFSPAMLFTTGVSGAWYDPSYFSTMFQNAAGTTPVTAVGQPVGLMLDKSKGLVLGPELVTNGDFSSGTTGWTEIAAGWSISGGAAQGLNVASFSTIGQLSATVSGRSYKCQITVSNYSSGQVYIYAGSAGYSPAIGANGTFTFILTASGNTGVFVRGNNGFTGSIDNISVRELPGNHAFNPSGNSANFPVLSARYNLLTKTEDVTDAAAWNYKINSSSVDYQTISFSGVGRFGRATGFSTGIQYAYSVEVKAGTKTGTVQLEDSNNPGTWTPITLTNNWQRLAISYTPTNPPYISVSSTDGNIGTVLVRNWDMRVANDALNQPSYQRVNTSTDYDTVGFKPYLLFNGVNQWLQTNSIDFTYGDKMFVSAGVRKLSDAALGTVVGLTTGIASNNGAFRLAAPGSAAPNLAWSAKGTTQVDLTSTTYTAPITSIVSGTADISGSSAIQRINGAETASSASSLGTGNFSNAALYLGASGGTANWLNGRLYGLVVAGKVASASEIASTEAWLNQKTGAY